jgi:2-deoxy-D-gluconate 3-dehydrogenase
LTWGPRPDPGPAAASALLGLVCSRGPARATVRLSSSAYTAAKSGLARLTRALANDWAARGINVNAIAPGYVVMELTTALHADPLRKAAMTARMPAGRWGQPGDLQGVAVFLASDAAEWVHGSVIVVDGGWLAR